MSILTDIENAIELNAVMQKVIIVNIPSIYEGFRKYIDSIIKINCIVEIRDKGQYKGKYKLNIQMHTEKTNEGKLKFIQVIEINNKKTSIRPIKAIFRQMQYYSFVVKNNENKPL